MVPGKRRAVRQSVRAHRRLDEHVGEIGSGPTHQEWIVTASCDHTITRAHAEKVSRITRAEVEVEYIHRICVPTSVAHGNEGSTVDEACLDGATTGNDVFFRNWADGDTTSPSCGIGDLGAGRERSVVRTADSTGESLIMLEVHLHAITSLILDVNGE